MSIDNITWKITRLERLTSSGLVLVVYWEASLSQEEITVRVRDRSELPYKEPSSDDFIPFDELTEEVVVEWVKAELGQEGIDRCYSELVSNLTVSMEKNSDRLPWGNRRT